MNNLLAGMAAYAFYDTKPSINMEFEMEGEAEAAIPAKRLTIPYASWQKGAIENTNKLIRQYIPKHTNFDEVTDKKIASIQKKINSRPRKKLKFETPKTEFFKRIA